MRLGTTRTPIKKCGRHSSWAADGLRSRTYTPVRESGVGMKVGSFVFGLIVGFCALAQQASPVLLGSWTATAGPNQIFRGTWSAQVSLNNPNRAIGSWTLLNEAGDVLLEGTWSTQKTGQHWQGTWTARATKGASFSGTWSAAAASLNAESLAEMLKSTATKAVTGSWRSGRHEGNWSLKGSPIKKLP